MVYFSITGKPRGWPDLQASDIIGLENDQANEKMEENGPVSIQRALISDLLQGDKSRFFLTSKKHSQGFLCLPFAPLANLFGLATIRHRLATRTAAVRVMVTGLGSSHVRYDSTYCSLIPT